MCLLKIATYNLELSQHQDAIIDNLVAMVRDGVGILCLQEVVIYENENIIARLQAKLGGDWEAFCHLGEKKDIAGMGNCILWNKKIISASSKHPVLLPYSQKFAIHEKVFTLLVGGLSKPLKRRSVFINFSLQGTEFCVANVHLDHNGGAKNRLKQLAYAKNQLDDIATSDKVILCGDFNCFDLLKTGYEYDSYEKLLRPDYVEATKNIDWTGDLYDVDTSKGLVAFGKTIRFLNIHVRRKIDYIWLKNIRLKECRKLDLSGSDHKPIVAEVVVG